MSRPLPPGAESWPDLLRALPDSPAEAVVLVQCSPGWLRPEATAPRNEIDEAVLMAQLRRPELRIDRFLLHSLPMAGGQGGVDAPTAARLAEVHQDWLYRISAATALLCPEGRAEPRVHRIIVQGDQPSVGIPDMVAVREEGAWSLPAAADALALLDRDGATTPLSRYDVNLDGPFGDADPSVHL
ncbi:hypothetical protein [Streptomyces zingiberis]|uniref:Uncharacterized protein n=1 Tax=Streptomyces zingiberis TaxID=2053010 RepID=A0ABX1C1N4_9ACTN|nr:hypothetical protein [Streptomyces zingiberis]NJQ01867.1 hypothetical protein [Streptomyces zingiberis]